IRSARASAGSAAAEAAGNSSHRRVLDEKGRAEGSDRRRRLARAILSSPRSRFFLDEGAGNNGQMDSRARLRAIAMADAAETSNSTTPTAAPRNRMNPTPKSAE